MRLLFVTGAVVVAFAVQSQPRSFVVAVTDWDSGLLPIARFAAGKWINTWPLPEHYETPVPSFSNVPPEWLGRPVPHTWRVWFTAGGNVLVRINNIKRPEGCLTSPTLVADSSIQRPPRLDDEIHIGLATTDDFAVQPIRRFERGEPVWDRLHALAERTLASGQAGAVAASKRHFPESWNTVTDVALAASNVSVLRVYRGGAPALQTARYRLEALKPVPASTLLIYLQAWVAAGADQQLRVMDATVDVGHSEFVREDLPILVPLGILPMGGEEVWVFEHPVGETTSFVLDAVGTVGVRRLLTVDAGGC